MTDASRSLHKLLHRRDLWRARDGLRNTRDTVLPSGFPVLDQALHGGGWPAAGLTELLCDTPCPPALRLLLPALAALDDGLVILAGPPARPRAGALHRAGLDLSRLLVLHSREPRILLRACHESAASGAAAALVAWLPRGADDPKTLRRLHLAAREGRCLLVAMRDSGEQAQPSPAPLRLLLQPCLPGDLAIQVLKQPGGWAGQQVRVPVLPDHLRTPPAPVADTSNSPACDRSERLTPIPVPPRMPPDTVIRPAEAD